MKKEDCKNKIISINNTEPDKKIYSKNYTEPTILYIDAELCKSCSLCKKKCPTGAISGKPKEIHSIEQFKCIQCGLCIKTCKFGAIKLKVSNSTDLFIHCKSCGKSLYKPAINYVKEKLHYDLSFYELCSDCRRKNITQRLRYI